jgi:hypothetical protein
VTKLSDPKKDDAESSVRAQSLLLPEDFTTIGGIYLHAIFGFMTGDENTFAIEQFHANPTFVRFMHATIRICGPKYLAPTAAAIAPDEESTIYVIDQRTPEGPQGDVPSHDIIGSFAVENSVIVEGSYWANPDHVLLSERGGFFQLPPPFYELIVGLLKKNAVPEGVYDDERIRRWDGKLPQT